ncbi:MAG TPA: hypothetical protein VKU00_10855 [Chthonomonadaceae bacterium]|nr:hypothetical protein [Chthonomonadaceae bacterium]
MHLLFPDANQTRKRLATRLLKGCLYGLLLALITSLTVGVLGTAQGRTSPKPPKNSMKNAGPTVPSRIIMVFPPDTKGGMSEVVSDSITDVERARLIASRKYRSVLFTRAIPTIRMGLVEQTISQTDVSHPFDDDAKLKKLAQYADYDLVLATTINDYQYDDKTNSVSVVLSIRMIDYSGEKPVVRSVGASMSSPENPAGNPRHEKIADSLIRNLTEKLMTDLLSPKPTTNPSAQNSVR